jgi:hypothetical protein
MSSQSPSYYIILSGVVAAVISGFFSLWMNSIKDKSQLEREEKQHIRQLEREEQQHIWQQKSDQQKWYREKIYDCYRTAAQLAPQIVQEYSDICLIKKAGKIVSEDKTMNLLKLTLEFSCEFGLLIAGHPDKNLTEFKEKIAKINKSLNEEPWNLLPMISEMMEHDPRIKNINK